MEPSPGIVELKNLRVDLDGANILHAVDLDLREPGILAIVGPNGSGKTTLLKVLLGLVTPTSGQAVVLGRPPGQSGPEVGYLPQASTQTADFPVSALDVVMMGLYPGLGLFTRPQAAEKERALKEMGRLGLMPVAKAPYSRLSGGERQRVGLARALVSRPRLLLLDEPATGMDAPSLADFYAYLGKLRDEREITIIMVSHDIGTIASVVDMVACLNGHIHYHGSPSEAFRPEVLRAVFGKDIGFILHDEKCLTCGEHHD